MIFHTMLLEKSIQTNDKTRLDSTRMFVSTDEGAITLVEIEPEAAAGFVDVTGSSSDDWFLDWAYATDGDKVATLRITTTLTAADTQTFTITAATPTDDRLFSGDDDLIPHEDDIMQYLRPGRNSYLDKHRVSQERIMGFLDEKRIYALDGTRLTKDQIFNVEEVRDWSKFQTLAIIFEALVVNVEDTFSRKADKYNRLMAIARNRAALRFDYDSNGTVDANTDIFSSIFVRR